MTFQSPWRHRVFCLGVELLRRLAPLLPGGEVAFINRLVHQHNRRIEQYLQQHQPRFVLLILPRCVKRSGCRCDVRRDGSVADGRQGEAHPLAECLECDLCPLGKVAELTERYDIRTFVAFRSYIAYAMARREQPDLIIATACGDRLIKALRSIPEIPALLTPLSTMERPCVNASFDLHWLEQQMEKVCRLADSLPTEVTAEAVSGRVPERRPLTTPQKRIHPVEPS
ncbi:MAG: DUF116 domain-containing protein [bacterium]